MREMTSAARRQICAECCELYGKPDAKGNCGLWVWMSEDVEDSDGVGYSFEGARWKHASRLLHRQERLLMPVPGTEGLVVRSAGEWFGFAAVKSQWRLMKIGMSENALKRWVLIWALRINENTHLGK